MSQQMTIAHGDDAFRPAAAAIRQGAAEVDGIFSRLGEKLGSGLEILEALNTTFSSLSRQLGGEGMDGATEALTGIARELQTLSANLPREGEMLNEILSRNGEASGFMVKLLQSMQMIAILARGARIEAVSVRSGSGDFADFTREIMALTERAQDVVKSCAKDQMDLSRLLQTAVRAQHAFSERYCGELATLSGELTSTFALIQERRRRSGDLAEKTAASSATIMQAVGAAIMALQSGDITRQRLEHVAAAIGFAEAREGLGQSAGEEAAIVALLCRLAGAQAEDVAATLAEEGQTVGQSLQLIEGDTGKLVEFGRHLYGGDERAASFVAMLEPQLLQASDLIRKCEKARADVDRVTNALTPMLERFQQTIPSLEEIISEIMLIGVNAGLRAVRLGTEGRGLVVIANEIKVIANRISADAGQLMPLFRMVHEASAGLMDEDRRGAGRMAFIDQAMQDIMVQLHDCGEALEKALSRLDRDATRFGGMLKAARGDLGGTTMIEQAVSSAAITLNRIGDRDPDFSPAEDAAARETVMQLVYGSYTMLAERRIHEAVIGPAAGSAPALAEATANDEDDVALWA